MQEWDQRHTTYEVGGQVLGSLRREPAPLAGTGVLRRGSKDVAPVTYLVRTITRRDPATGDSTPYYGGRIDLIGGELGGSDWGAAEDLVLHLLEHGSHLGVLLHGSGATYTLRGRGNLITEKAAKS